MSNQNYSPGMDSTTMMLMMNAMNHPGGGGGAGGNPILNVFYTFLQIIIIAFSKKAEEIVNKFLALINKLISDKTNGLLNNVENSTGNLINTVLPKDLLESNEFDLEYKPDKYSINIEYYANRKKDKGVTSLDDYLNTNYKYIKYLFEYIVTLNHISSIQLTSYEKIPNIIGVPIEISKDIFLIIKELSIDLDTTNISKCLLELNSNKFTNEEIMLFLKKIEEMYIVNLDDINSNHKIYYFDTHLDKNSDGARLIKPNGISYEEHELQLLKMLDENILFTKKIFCSNRTFSSLVGDTVDKIKNKINFFCEKEDWYNTKGIPYHLGILLAGVPGSGKTSCIKAIANTTRRHIININFKYIKTSLQFKNLFLQEKIQVFNKETNNKEWIRLPMSKRLYVLEEIDILGDVVLDRSRKKNKNKDAEDKSAINLKLTLDDILTILDGTLETPGRIVVITSNHPEKLDPALIRGGRIDVLAKFDYCTRTDVIKYLKFFYSIDTLDETLITYTQENKLSFATLTGIVSYNELDEAIELINAFKLLSNEVVEEPVVVAEEPVVNTPELKENTVDATLSPGPKKELQSYTNSSFVSNTLPGIEF